jgi:menaquinone-9 beta-reductase
MYIFDIIIIGAGSAGLSAALTLSKSNTKILLIDKCSFPRDKICGDGLTSESALILRQFGVLNPILKRGFISDSVDVYPFNDERSITKQHRIVTLKRSILDNILMDKAVNNNIKFLHRKFTGKISSESEYVSLEFLNPENGLLESLSSKYFILATGSSFAPMKNIKGTKRANIATIRGYYRADWNITNPLVYLDESDITLAFYLFPMGDNLFNIGCCRLIGHKKKVDLRELLNDFIENRLKIKYGNNGNWEDKPTGECIRSDLLNIKNAVLNHGLMAGESLGTTCPFTGEGISKALKSGIIASETILKCLQFSNDKFLSEYKSRIKTEIGKTHTPYKILEFIATKKILRNWLFPKACKSSFIQSKLLTKFGDEMDSGTILELKSILRLIIKLIFRK